MMAHIAKLYTIIDIILHGITAALIKWLNILIGKICNKYIGNVLTPIVANNFIVGKYAKTIQLIIIPFDKAINRNRPSVIHEYSLLQYKILRKSITILPSNFIKIYKSKNRQIIMGMTYLILGKEGVCL